MKSKKLKVGAVAMALVFAMSGSAFAAGGSAQGAVPGSPTDQEYKQNADTTFNIFSTSQNAGNMSYTVPLYVTMAVSSDQDNVAVPNDYGIINNSIIAQGSQDKMEIGVTGMKFEKLNNSTYQTFDTVADTATTPEAIQLSIGGVKMPKQLTPGFQDLTFTSNADGGIFWDGTHPKVIAPSQARFDIPIVGKVGKMQRDDKKAAAQFRVKYTVSLLKSDTHEPVGGTVITTSDWHQAGLQDWDENKVTN